MFLCFFIQIRMVCFQAFQSIFLWHCEPTPQVELLEKQAEQQKALDEAKDRDGFSASMVQGTSFWVCLKIMRNFMGNMAILWQQIDDQPSHRYPNWLFYGENDDQLWLWKFSGNPPHFFGLSSFSLKKCNLGYILYHFRTKLFEALRILLSIWEGTIPLEEYHEMIIEIFF